MSAADMRRIVAFSAVLREAVGSELYAFQVRGAEFLAERRVAILADEPGLGKVVQCIAALHELRGDLVAVGPATAVEEFHTDPWSGVTHLRHLRLGNFAFVTYESDEPGSLLSDKSSTLIVDRPHLSASTWLVPTVAAHLARGGRVWFLGCSKDVALARPLVREHGVPLFDHPEGKDVLRRRARDVTASGWKRKLEFVPMELAPGESGMLEVTDSERLSLDSFEVFVPGPLAVEARNYVMVERVRIGNEHVFEGALSLAQLPSLVVPPHARLLQPYVPVTIELRNTGVESVTVALAATGEVVVDVPRDVKEVN